MKKARLRELLATKEGKAIHAFLAELSDYQQSSGGRKARLRNRHASLSDEMRSAVSASASRLRGLWRGDEGQSRDPATSWTNGRSTAAFFGTYVFPVTDLSSTSGSIDTEKVRRLIENVRELEDHDVGDDEGEVILLDPVWKPMSRERMDRERRA